MSQKARAAVPQGGKETEQSQSVAGCLAYLAWSIGGFGILVMLWVLILRAPPWTLTLRDALYWTAVLGMIAARHFDIAYYGGRTGTGELATSRDARLYAAVLLAAAGPLWCVAQAFEL